MTTLTKHELDAMVEEAIVDAYGESEQVTGLFTMIEDNLEVSFETVVLGVPVTVEEIDLTDGYDIVARCSRDGHRQSSPIRDLPLPTPPPASAEWIEAYRHWAG